ncbi:thiamine-monophosphate kinase [Arthrobacter sp. Hiyo4]|nr:thiamine-monophosphate kinase [Arthrobacter sp. Hiyo4]
MTVAVLGSLAGGNAVLRSGASAGDVVALAGTVGRAAAGLALLEAEAAVQSLAPAQWALVEVQCRPRPPLSAGPLARSAGATAMLDISDGLVRDGGRLAAASGVVLDLDPATLKPFAEALRPASDLLRADPWSGCWAGERTTGCWPHSRPVFSCLPDSLR